MNHIVGVLLALSFTTACQPSELETKTYHLRSSAQTENAEPHSQGTEPKLDSGLDQDLEPIAIPHNVSGQYLVACNLSGDHSSANSSPAMVNFQCNVENDRGEKVAAQGLWSGSLRQASADQSLRLSSAERGEFALISAQSASLAEAAGRILVQFHGTIENSPLTIVQMNFSQLAAEIQKVQLSHPISYEFTVRIVSGSLAGQSYKGTFSYDPKLLKGQGTETITVQTLQFSYLASNQQNFDSPGVLSFNNGVLNSLALVGGPGTKRFGINAGFDRRQFARDSEAFVRNGEPYFAYLDSSTFVDGAGTISYRAL